MVAIPTVVVKKGKDRMRVNAHEIKDWEEKGWSKAGAVKDPHGSAPTKVATKGRKKKAAAPSGKPGDGDEGAGDGDAGGDGDGAEGEE